MSETAKSDQTLVLRLAVLVLLVAVSGHFSAPRLCCLLLFSLIPLSSGLLGVLPVSESVARRSSGGFRRNEGKTISRTSRLQPDLPETSSCHRAFCTPARSPRTPLLPCGMRVPAPLPKAAGPARPPGGFRPRFHFPPSKTQILQ